MLCYDFKSLFSQHSASYYETMSVYPYVSFLFMLFSFIQDNFTKTTSWLSSILLSNWEENAWFLVTNWPLHF